MAQITSDDVQRWLEETADRWIEHPGVTPVLLPGVTEVGIRVLLDQRSVRAQTAEGLLSDRVKIPDRQFYAIWLGLEFTTMREL